MMVLLVVILIVLRGELKGECECRQQRRRDHAQCSGFHAASPPLFLGAG
jgi:hypothetical protein